MDKRLERILPRVQKPARYVGGEFNAIMKDKSKVDTRVAFCFPDTYEIGMSNLGMRILYGVMNNIEGVWCERCFAPWGDMEQEMRNANIPLYALESFDPIKDFDIIAFSIGYEMAFPAMVDMLDLAGVPLHASERTALTPLVVAGGTAMYNCEPIADFIDLALIGEGEEMDVELIELHRQARREGWSKHEFLVCAAQIPGVYVPSALRRCLQRRRHGQVHHGKRGCAQASCLKRIVQDHGHRATIRRTAIVPEYRDRA